MGLWSANFSTETSVIFNNDEITLAKISIEKLRFICSIASRIRMMAKLSASILHTKYLVYLSNHIAIISMC